MSYSSDNKVPPKACKVLGIPILTITPSSPTESEQEFQLFQNCDEIFQKCESYHTKKIEAIAALENFKGKDDIIWPPVDLALSNIKSSSTVKLIWQPIPLIKTHSGIFEMKGVTRLYLEEVKKKCDVHIPYFFKSGALIVWTVIPVLLDIYLKTVCEVEWAKQWIFQYIKEIKPVNRIETNII